MDVWTLALVIIPGLIRLYGTHDTHAWVALLYLCIGVIGASLELVQ